MGKRRLQCDGKCNKDQNYRTDQMNVMLGNFVIEQVDIFKFISSYKVSSCVWTKDNKILISMEK